MDQHISTNRLDYLLRSGVPSSPTTTSIWTSAPALNRRLSRVMSVGKYDKHVHLVQSESADASRRSAGLLTGLHGSQVPLAFLLRGNSDGIEIDIGIWSAKTIAEPSPKMDSRMALVRAALHSLYPTVEMATVDSGPSLVAYPRRGLVLGVPEQPDFDVRSGDLPLDRLIRAMGSDRWAALTLLQPVSDVFSLKLKHELLNEMRHVESLEQNTTIRPLSRHYLEVLSALLESLHTGYASGNWRTAVYLFGDEQSFSRLAASWISVYSSSPTIRSEKLRIVDPITWGAEARMQLADWGMPDPAANLSVPGLYAHPFEHQTLLSSAHAAAYVHLPRHETPGFAVKDVPRFDVVPPVISPASKSLALGSIIHLTQTTTSRYEIAVDSLTRHAFVAGVTGSGKTNTVMRLLEGISSHNLPFLVIEPVKSEYRALRSNPLLEGKLRVFTAGDETGSPLRMNPFEIRPGVKVAQHIDLLRTVFAAGFRMWTPLPQILERCLHELYSDYGWNLATNTNRRLADGDKLALAAPTLSDLIGKVQEVVPELGYGARLTPEMEAALLTRLNALRQGGKGQMLDTRNSLPMDALLGEPTVLELSSMSDDDDKAFLMALLLANLVEHRLTEPRRQGLHHLLVIEEAHRLLSAVASTAGDDENPRGRAVTAFTNLLAEVRAYGQGVVIADQVPSRLASDVIKNTGLKIAHRTVAADDRAVLAGAMALDANRSSNLASLSTGDAAVYAVDTDAALLVRVGQVDASSLSDGVEESLEGDMRKWRIARGFDSMYLPSPVCRPQCAQSPEVCGPAEVVLRQPYVQKIFSRLVLSVSDDARALDRVWNDLVQAIRPRRPVYANEADLLDGVLRHGAAWYASRRGAQGDWSFGETRNYEDALYDMLAGKASHPSKVELPQTVTFLEIARRLHVRSFPPFTACDAICDQQSPPVCMYRHAVADLVSSGSHSELWFASEAADRGDVAGNREKTWGACRSAAFALFEWPDPALPADDHSSVEDSFRRVGLCFLQQMLEADNAKLPESKRTTIRETMVFSRRRE